MSRAEGARHPLRLVRASRVITMDGASDSRGGVDAFVTLGERVIAVGDAGDLRGRFPEAETVDLGGGVVVPGFNDAHAHPSLLADGGLYMDLAPAVTRSAEDVRRALAERAARTPDGGWVVGHNFDVSRTEDGGAVDRALLDRVSARHPVLIIHYSYHGAVANSAALAAAGYDEHTPDPVGGELVRDGGRLTGVVWERAWMEGFLGHGSRPPLVPAPTTEARVGSLRRVIGEMNAAGITSICDAMVHPHDWKLYQTARDQGVLTARVGMLLWYEFFDPAPGPATGFGDEWLRFTGVKMMSDGAVSGGTCLCSRPYRGARGEPTGGIQVMPDEEITDVVHRVHAAGARLAVHANGDLAIAKVLDAMERATAATPPRPGQAHRIEHCSVVDGRLVRRIRDLGVIPVPFGAFVRYHGRNLLDHYGPERAARISPHRTFREAGITVAGSSDHPCGPPEPLYALQSLTTRRSLDGTVLGEEERLTPYEALEVYTVGSAAASGEEHVKGRIAPGYLADFTVLAEDPLRADPERLAEVPVTGTWVGGRPVWGG
ncbi:amidohydrolase [Actinomadura litoris]|uniref:Amidohydrolase family protein n=1 Tax=Actinomadura litoris TaxID=2678616 RepID=A0A7K1L2M0_9ACTN|nr:amidohydrolase [Actinomadura litoris]MUN38486.1 amidohydrolase family protein [Actinomadura litoris]